MAYVKYNLSFKITGVRLKSRKPIQDDALNNFRC